MVSVLDPRWADGGTEVARQRKPHIPDWNWGELFDGGARSSIASRTASRMGMA
jgi:hypothetical protein